MRKLVLAGLVVVSTLGPARASSQAVVETYSLWNGSDGIAPFSADGGSYSYGQTFTAPAQYLNSWSFWTFTQVAGVSFSANIAEWTGTTIGSVLWTSGPHSEPGGAGYLEINFQTGGVSLLTGGQSYIFFLDAISGPGRLALGAMDDVYASGRSEWSNITDETGAWSTFFEADFVFRAEFDRVPAETVPEPATMTLLATGLAGMAAARKRKRNA